MALPIERPTRSAPTSPGPRVAATTSISRTEIPARASASPLTAGQLARCSREAISGTTPPYGRCAASWLDTTDDSTRPAPSSTAQAVSSQEVSMPRTSGRAMAESLPLHLHLSRILQQPHPRRLRLLPEGGDVGVEGAVDVDQGGVDRLVRQADVLPVGGARRRPGGEDGAGGVADLGEGVRLRLDTHRVIGDPQPALQLVQIPLQLVGGLDQRIRFGAGVGSRVLLPALDLVFFFNDTATAEIYTLSLHDALP